MGRKRIVQGVGLLAALLCFASLAVAQTDTFTLMGANPDGNNMSGVYVSPYLATITGSTGTIYQGEVICDDYTDEVSVGESWQVTSSAAWAVSGQLFTSSVTLGSTTYTNQQAYDALAWLATQLLGFSLNDSADQALYSYAIWGIFDPSSIPNYTGAGGTGAVTNLISTAFSENYTGTGVTVWTPTGCTSGAGCSGSGPNKGLSATPQEFLTVQTPEASLPATLAVELSALVGVIFLMRRRLVRV